VAKFVYRMQGILNVKEKMETQAKNEFAIASAHLHEEEEKQRILILRKDNYQQELETLYRDNLDLRKINETQNAVENLKYQIRIQQIQIQMAEDELERARLKLQEAMLERKTHEKLKEREFEQFLADEAAGECKEIDELVSYRFGQKEEG